MKPPIYHRMLSYNRSLLPNPQLAVLEHSATSIDQARQKSGATIGYPGWGSSTTCCSRTSTAAAKKSSSKPAPTGAAPPSSSPRRSSMLDAKAACSPSNSTLTMPCGPMPICKPPAWPSYEMVTTSPIEITFLPDRVHVRDEMVSQIIGVFLSRYIND
jgi:hypothetical protein